VVLTDLTSLQVVAGFSETDAAKVRLGQPATVTFNSLPNQQLAGTVSQIDVNSQTVSNVVTYNVTVSIVDPPATLKPGMTANLSVITAKRDNVVQLPSSAVTARGSAATVQVQQANGKTVATNVTIGLKGDTADEITSGLAPGAKVVVTRTVSSGGTTTGGTNRPGAGITGGLTGGGGGGGVRGG
jgi:multidrug efflux pump subunit AcrA (membrane-fusion protein)